MRPFDVLLGTRSKIVHHSAIWLVKVKTMMQSRFLDLGAVAGYLFFIFFGTDPFLAPFIYRQAIFMLVSNKAMIAFTWYIYKKKNLIKLQNRNIVWTLFKELVYSHVHGLYDCIYLICPNNFLLNRNIKRETYSSVTVEICRSRSKAIEELYAYEGCRSHTSRSLSYSNLKLLWLRNGRPQ